MRTNVVVKCFNMSYKVIFLAKNLLANVTLDSKAKCARTKSMNASLVSLVLFSVAVISILSCPDPCINGGKCTDLVGDYSCDCLVTGFKGKNCEININECKLSECQNGATCVDKVNDYDCDCLPGTMSLMV